MTLSEDTHPYPAISPCPPWCATDHSAWKYTHESEHTPIFDNPVLIASYAVGSTSIGGDERVTVYGRDTSAGPVNGSLSFDDPAEAYRFAALLELLAKHPGQIGALAAQVRAAAMAISGETS